MALNPPFIARIEKRLPGSFGDTMNDLRSWLDYNKIEPALFKQSDGVEFEIGFDNEEAARLFWREFFTRSSSRRRTEATALCH